MQCNYSVQEIIVVYENTLITFAIQVNASHRPSADRKPTKANGCTIHRKFSCSGYDGKSNAFIPVYIPVALYIHINQVTPMSSIVVLHARQFMKLNRVYCKAMN